MREPLKVVDAPLYGERRDYVGDLDASQFLVTRDRALLWAPLTDGIRSAAGAVSVGVLATFVDVITSMPTIVAAKPDWTATQSLAVHAADWLVEGPVVLDARLVRAGKKVVVVRADLWDGRGLHDVHDLLEAFDATPGAADEDGVGARSDGSAGSEGPVPGGGRAGDPVLAGRALITFARIPRAAAGDFPSRYDPESWMGSIVRRTFDPPATDAVRERIGLQVVDGREGVVEVASVPYVTNSIGTINGGVLAVMVEHAAEALRPGLVATDLSIQYLSQMKVGPARTRATVSRDAGDHSVVTVEVVDHGGDDQLLALATVTLQPPPG